MTERQQPDQEADFWNVDMLIGELTLWQGERYALRLMAHDSEEIYRQPAREEIIPLAHQRGVRTTINARAYVLLPDITATLGQPAPGADAGAVATVSASSWAGMRSERVGSMQAWYYHEDRSVVLWECFLEEQYRGANPVEDANSYSLWEGFERFLIHRFPHARQLVTPSDEDLYELAEYQQFLQSLGYSRLNPQAFGKTLSSGD